MDVLDCGDAREHLRQLQEHVTAAEAADAKAADVAKAMQQVIQQNPADPLSETDGGIRACAKQKITQAFRSLRQALDAREQELMTKVDTLAQEHLAEAAKQLNELGMYRSALRKAIDFAKQMLAISPSESDARYCKPCIEMLQIATRTERPEAVDAAIPVNLPTDDVLRTISSFGCAGAPGAPLEADCELLGSSAVVTWQPPEESSALPVVAYVVQRAVGETGQYEPVGRVHAARFEQCVEDVGGQALRYRVQAKDRGGNVGAWVRIPAVQLPPFGIELRFQSLFDGNGVLHHLGTAGRRRRYKNPHITGTVKASVSSFFFF